MEHEDTKKTAYIVRANPVLHELGSLSGQLDFARFTADSGKGTHKEWRVDAAVLDQALHSLDSSALRYEVLNNLRSGARADLPGSFTAADLARLGYSAGRLEH
jgi:hypothetical protein